MLIIGSEVIYKCITGRIDGGRSGVYVDKDMMVEELNDVAKDREVQGEVVEVCSRYSRV